MKAMGGGYFLTHPLQFGNYWHIKEKWPHRTVAEKLLQYLHECLLAAILWENTGDLCKCTVIFPLGLQWGRADGFSEVKGFRRDCSLATQGEWQKAPKLMYIIFCC